MSSSFLYMASRPARVSSEVRNCQQQPWTDCEQTEMTERRTAAPHQVCHELSDEQMDACRLHLVGRR